MSTLKDLRNIRLEKLNKLKELGVDPYPAKSFKNIDNIKAFEKFDEIQNTEVIAGGRITSIRKHGQLAFIDIEDNSSKISVVVFKNDELNLTKYSTIEVEGKVLQYQNRFEIIADKIILLK